jgi:mRNA interferase ChpB
VIISPAAFNSATKLPVVVPITKDGDFARRIGFAVPVAGIGTTGIVRCDQPRVIDLQARGGRKVDTLPAEIMDEALAKVRPVFE